MRKNLPKEVSAVKKYSNLELIGKVDGKYLEEVFRYTRDGERRITMSKRRIAGIAVAAVMAVVLGVTAVAAYRRGLSTMQGYISDREENHIHLPEGFATVPAEDIGTEIEPEAEKEFLPGDARVTSVLMSRDAFYATVELNVSDAGLDDAEYPDYFDGKFNYGKFSMSAVIDGEEEMFGYVGNAPMVSYEDGIMTLVMHFSSSIPDGAEAINVEIGEFGYTSYDNPPDKEHVAVSDKVYSFSVPIDESSIVKPIESVNSAECAGVTFTAAVDNLGLHFYPQGLEPTDKNNELISNIVGENEIGIKMKDGTEIRSLYYRQPSILGSGFTGAEEVYFSFETIVDTSQVESLSLGGAVFTFE